MSALEDRLFTKFCRTGSPKALGQVYDRLADELYGVARHLAGDPATAEDLVQRTFVTAIERASTFRRGERVMPWLCGILARHARDEARRAGRRPDPLRLALREAVEASAEVEERELEEALEHGLERLPDPQRAVLVLRLRHGMTAAEIADALNRPPGTVRSQLARGLEALRDALPRGLAGAALVALGLPRGLDAVRASVLESARALSPSLVAIAKGHALFALESTLSVMLMKKSVTLASLGLAALATLGYVLHDPLEPPTTPELQPTAKPRLAGPALGPASAADEASDREPSRTAAATLPEPPTAEESSASAAPATGRIEVLVRDARGRPIEGEGLRLERSPAGDAWGGSRHSTDAGGRALFDAVPSGHWTLYSLRADLVTVELEADEHEFVELEIPLGLTVRGHVRDLDDNPIPDAEVWLSDHAHTRRGAIVGRADSAGAFELRAVAPDQYVGARAPGFADGELWPIGGVPGQERELTLTLSRPNGSLTVRVVDERDEPIADAEVLIGRENHAFDRRTQDGRYLLLPPPRALRTDALGEARANGLALGEIEVQVRAQGFGGSRRTALVEAAGPARLEVRLPVEARVHGRVLAPGGRGLSFARVLAQPRYTFLAPTATAGLDGRYELRGLGAGEVELLSELSGYGRAEATLELAAGERRELDLVLRRRPMLRVRLVDSGGRTVTGWAVMARDEQTKHQHGARRVHEDGCFEIECDGAGPFTLIVRRPEDWSGLPVLQVGDLRPSDEVHEYRLPDLDLDFAQLRLVVSAPAGAPAVGARLELWHIGLEHWQSFEVTDENGELIVGGLPAGEVDLTLRHADFPMQRLGRHTLVAGEPLDLGERRFSPTGRLAARLDGLAVDALPEDLEFHLVTPKGEYGLVERDGLDLTASALAPGHYTLTVIGRRVRQLRLPVEIRVGETTQLSVPLERVGSRLLRFRTPEPADPPLWISAGVLDATGGLEWSGVAKRIDDRHFELLVSAAPGLYSLNLQDGRQRTAVRSLEITSIDREYEPIDITWP